VSFLGSELTTKLITPPTAEPVTLAEACGHLKIGVGSDDTYVTGLITAARVYAEMFTRRAFLTQEWEQYFHSFPRAGIFPDRHQLQYSEHAHHWFIRLLRPPLQTVEFIKYVDTGGNVVTLDPSLYVVYTQSEPARISPIFGGFWPPTRITGTAANPFPVTVRHKSGFGDTASAALSAEPKFQVVKTFIMQAIGHWYYNREPVVAGSVSELPHHMKNLLYCLVCDEF